MKAMKAPVFDSRGHPRGLKTRSTSVVQRNHSAPVEFLVKPEVQRRVRWTGVKAEVFSCRGGRKNNVVMY